MNIDELIKIVDSMCDTLAHQEKILNELNADFNKYLEAFNKIQQQLEKEINNGK